MYFLYIGLVEGVIVIRCTISANKYGTHQLLWSGSHSGSQGDSCTGSGIFLLSELDEAATGTEKVEGGYVAKHPTMYKIDSEWRNVLIRILLQILI